jgi:broad specificity phosphatase PhoE
MAFRMSISRINEQKLKRSATGRRKFLGYCLPVSARTGERSSMPTVFFITHPDVVIDPAVPVSDWPLSDRGRARMREMADLPWARRVRRIFSSSERKARDGAEILAAALGLAGYGVVDGLRENDRSATGYLPPQEFEATADAFFAHPQGSVRGWEPAAQAQARIVDAVDRILAQIPAEGDLAIVGHGGTGTLLYCHLLGSPIDRRHDQPATNGGNWFAFDRFTRRPLHDGWQSIDATVEENAPAKNHPPWKCSRSD